MDLRAFTGVDTKLPPKLQYKILCKGKDENDLNYTGADHCGLSA